MIIFHEILSLVSRDQFSPIAVKSGGGTSLSLRSVGINRANQDYTQPSSYCHQGPLISGLMIDCSSHNQAE